MTSAAAAFRLVLNGEAVDASGLPPQTNLLDFVRSRGLTGSKEGCAEGECGACAVLVLGDDERGRPVYRAVNSCLIPWPAAAGREVWTVESLASHGELAEVQRAMVERGGSQCGYCTPGFIVSMFAAQYGGKRAFPASHVLAGNLCRCTGYRPIRDAFDSLGPPPPGPFLERLNEPASSIQPFDFENRSGRFSRPANLKDACALAAGNPEAAFVAGHTDLGVIANLQGRRYPHLISLESIEELRSFHEDENSIEIGSGLTLTEIGERWTGAPPIFREWLELFASPLIRNRATLGGNLATASPIGDSAPMLLALDAELIAWNSGGDRVIPLEHFFTAYRATVLARDEIIRSVRIPKPLPRHARFYKVAKRALDDISTVAMGIAFVNGRLRIGLGGVAPTPVRMDMERRAGHDIVHRLRPIGDHRGSAEYRLAVAASLIEKFLVETGI